MFRERNPVSNMADFDALFSGYCSACIGIRIRENNDLFEMLMMDDILGSVLNTNCVSEIVGFVRGLVLTFKLS